MRGATSTYTPRGWSLAFQSTHPLRGATVRTSFILLFPVISIHAPLAGCDSHVNMRVHGIRISIHAPLAGCDASLIAKSSSLANFNPRTPCGVRRNFCDRFIGSFNFNPRTPCGVRQYLQRPERFRGKISIHAPLAGCDKWQRKAKTEGRDFNPRTPCGVRPCKETCQHPFYHFNPRTPCGVRLLPCNALKRPA